MQAHKLLLVTALAVTVSLAALIRFYPSTGDFRADNPFWNGLETFTARFHGYLMDSFGELPSTPSGTVLILIPYQPFAETDLVSIRNFVLQGGTLIVLDDYGYGNQILSYLELELRFTGNPLLDPLFNYRSKWLPRGTGFSDPISESGLMNIVLNHASTLSNISDMTVTAWSSKFSYLDLDSDSTYDPDEPRGPLPIAAYIQIGEGDVVAISDPSILINSMINIDDNTEFIRDILNLRGSNLKVYVDQSHLSKTRLDEAKEDIIEVYNVVSSPAGMLGLITVILILTLAPIWRRKGE